MYQVIKKAKCEIFSQQIPRFENEDGSAVPIRTGLQQQSTCDKVHQNMSIVMNYLLYYNHAFQNVCNYRKSRKNIQDWEV
uniref:Uncharacterized protein n=1 Tax=Romanomermis culicivorax TaxID=13658 RepID=A0A915HH37_ROMCU